MNALIIGSSLIDLFLELSSNAHTRTDSGTVKFNLGDKIPVEIKKLTLGGNGANVSVGLRRLGIPTSFYTYLGSDILSAEIEEKLCGEGITLLAEKGKGENSSLSIILGFKTDRIIFSHHQVRNHTFEYKEKTTPDFLYLTSIGKEWGRAYQEALEFAASNKIPLAFSPGSHQIDEMNEIVIKAVGLSTLLFVNKEEAEKIANVDEKDIKKLLIKIQTMGPKTVSITDGKNGAYAIDEDGTQYEIAAIDEGNQEVEKTGAGDAYASGFLASYLFGNSISECMQWGAFNAFSSMKYIGAQQGLLSKLDMQEALLHHSDIKAEKI